MKVFVTGGAGFIGSRLCHYLVNSGHSVTAYDSLMLGQKKFIQTLEKNPDFKFIQNDLTTDAELENHVQGHELVFHLAANSDISRGAQITDLDFKHGTLSTYKILEAMRLGGCGKLIFASTSAIYGEATVKPTPEDYGPLVPISFYGASKLGAEALISAFSHNYPIQSWVFRFANIVGPNLTHGAIYDFVQRLKLDPEVLRVLGNGLQRKSYLHVDDCIDGMFFGFKNTGGQHNILNLASPGVTEVRYIAAEVVLQMNLQAKIEYGNEDRGWKGDVPYTWLDDNRLKQLGWRAKMTSDEAVRQSISEAIQ